jgi:serine-aspartate repeat-containing protein C/D/E
VCLCKTNCCRRTSGQDTNNINNANIEDTDSDSESNSYYNSDSHSESYSHSESNSYYNSDSNSDTDSEINENNEVITEISDSCISLEIDDSDLFN